MSEKLTCETKPEEVTHGQETVCPQCGADVHVDLDATTCHPVFSDSCWYNTELECWECTECWDK